ncbi:MAG: alpha-glucosidase [Treponema sp.]|jgi:oligo-1,6-glucosidase|nr:alpha-glucosidase [Treponema sp.]
MKPWWKESVIYQIYPRSFQDSNGDGIGDIPGIISRLDEVAALGVKGLWLSPVYPSPQVDNGYDISDYCGIDPLFGTMADMERLIAEAKKRDLRIIMDLVINHSSDEHEWFQKSRRREPGYEDYYIWKPGKNSVAPEKKTGQKKKREKQDKRDLPNNWTSFFMEDAWDFDEVRGEYYLHLFHKRQPDLNYKNPRVIEEVKKILAFWLDKGVAGFRCDVINVLYKTSLEDGKKSIMLTGKEHYLCQEGNHEILRRLRREVLDRYSAEGDGSVFTVGETAMVELTDAKLLSGEARRELDLVFYFDHLEVDRRVARFIPKKFRASELLRRLAKWQQGLDWNALYLENHDQSRVVSHYGDDSLRGYWERSAKLLATLEFTLRGTPFIYQGQEIGMTNFDFTGLDQVKDIETHNLNRLMKKLFIPGPLRWKWLRLSSRDNARTPFQWNREPGAGFTEAVRPGEPGPWLGINGNHTRINYEAQKDDPDSVLSYYKKMIRIRAESDTLKYGAFRPLFSGRRLMMYRRVPAELSPADSGAPADPAPPLRAGSDPAPSRAGPPGETWTVALNFSGRRLRLNARQRSLLRGALAVSNTGGHTGEAGLAEPVRYLEPWEAVAVKQ